MSREPGWRPDSEAGALPAAALVAFAVGAVVGFAMSSQRGKRGDHARELVDELVRAARDGALSSRRGSPVLDLAVRRLRALGDQARNGWRT